MTLLYRSGDRGVSSDKEVGEGLEGQMAGPWPFLVVGVSLGLFCRTEARGRSLFVLTFFFHQALGSLKSLKWREVSLLVWVMRQSPKSGTSTQ